MLGFNFKKAVQALVFVAEKEKPAAAINKMKAFKLLWLADRAHLRNYGRTILGDIYFALNYGPIPSNTKDLAENSSFLSDIEREYREMYLVTTDKYTYYGAKNCDMSVFSKTDIEMFEATWNVFGMKTPFELSEISHEYPEWKKHETALKSGQASRFLMDYEDFFLNTSSENESFFRESPTLLELSKEIYIETEIIKHLV